MKPFWSIITPTLNRESLVRCCDSITNQSTSSWEHIVAVDRETLDDSLMERIAHPQRRIFRCGPFSNYGNAPRNLAWQYATGTMIHHEDDDNYLADQNILEDMQIALVTSDYPDWACFPIMRHGQRFFSEEPRCCHADTMNIVAKREIARWPNIGDYTADGIWIDTLRANHEYSFKAFPEFRPIGIMETSGRGEFNG